VTGEIVIGGIVIGVKMVMKRRPAAARRIQNLVRRAAVALTAFTSKGGGCPVTLGGVARILTRIVRRPCFGWRTVLRDPLRRHPHSHRRPVPLTY
jgi:hypothetical protein